MQEKPLAALSPELKAWADGVIVPALMRAWLAQHGPDKDLAPGEGDVVECAASSTASAEEGV